MRRAALALAAVYLAPLAVRTLAYKIAHTDQTPTERHRTNHESPTPLRSRHARR